MSDSVRPHRQQQPTRLHHPWDSPGKNTGVGCHFLFQCRKVKVKSLSRIRLLATPWTAAHRAPPSRAFPALEWVPLPSPSRVDLVKCQRSNLTLEGGLSQSASDFHLISKLWLGSEDNHKIIFFWTDLNSWILLIKFAQYVGWFLFSQHFWGVMTLEDEAKFLFYFIHYLKLSVSSDARIIYYGMWCKKRKTFDLLLLSQ